MAKLEFDFDIEGALQADPYLDRYTIQYLFEQTKQSLGQGLQRKLDGLQCAEHGAEPTITIIGRYQGQHEQMAIDYHLDTCCQPFMLQVVKTLNNVN